MPPSLVAQALLALLLLAAPPLATGARASLPPAPARDMAASPLVIAETEMRLPLDETSFGGMLARLPGAAPRAGVLIIPGSGPTDRDGNSPLGVRSDVYRLLARALAEAGIASLRIDKRGMFSSASPGIDPNAVTLELYASDVHRWLDHWRALEPDLPLYLLGHSEGGLVSMLAAQTRPDLAGVILAACPGRPAADVLRAQLRANPANAPLLEAADTAISRLEAGQNVDARALPPPLLPLFAEPLQGFLISFFAARPAELIARLPQPLLIIQGDNDLQVGAADARLLSDANPRATLREIKHMNHLLKIAPRNLAGNFATYQQPALPLAPDAVRELAEFILTPRP